MKSQFRLSITGIMKKKYSVKSLLFYKRLVMMTLTRCTNLRNRNELKIF